MSEADLEVFLLRIAFPPVRLGLYMKRLNARAVQTPPQPESSGTSCAALNGFAHAWPGTDGGN